MLKTNLTKGFTFIEVMIAMLLLTVGIIASLRVFGIGLNVETGNQLQTQATMLAQGKMEELNFQTYQNIAIGTTTEAFAVPFERFTRVSVVSYVDADLHETITDTKLKKITIVVSWTPFSLFSVTANSVSFAALIAEI